MKTGSLECSVLGATKGAMVNRFLQATKHPQLSQRKVAVEVVFLLTHYERLSPPVLQNLAGALGLGMSHEGGELLAGWLGKDGWVQREAHPWVGKGMSAVWAYEPTEKWRRLARSG